MIHFAVQLLCSGRKALAFAVPIFFFSDQTNEWTLFLVMPYVCLYHPHFFLDHSRLAVLSFRRRAYLLATC